MTETYDIKEPVSSLETRMVDVDGQLLRVGIRHGGKASPPLLIFNGIGANLELVEPFAAALGDVEVIVFDIPGPGRRRPDAASGSRNPPSSERCRPDPCGRRASR